MKLNVSSLFGTATRGPRFPNSTLTLLVASECESQAPASSLPPPLPLPIPLGTALSPPPPIPLPIPLGTATGLTSNCLHSRPRPRILPATA